MLSLLQIELTFLVLIGLVWAPCLAAVTIAGGTGEGLARVGGHRWWVEPTLAGAVVVGVLLVAAGAVGLCVTPRIEKPLVVIGAGLFLAAFALLSRGRIRWARQQRQAEPGATAGGGA